MPTSRIEWPRSLAPDAKYDFVLVLPHADSAGHLRDLFRAGLQTDFNVRIAIEIKPTDAYVLTAPNGINARPARADGRFGFGSMSTGLGASRTGSFAIGSAQPGPPGIPEAVRLTEILEPVMAQGETPQTSEGFAEMLKRTTRQFASLVTVDNWIAAIDSTITMAELCDTLEAGLGGPVLDETNLKGVYAISVNTRAITAEEFLRALCDQLGLVATVTRRDVPTLVVRPRKPDAGGL